jgi:hypothetical protein
MRKLIATLILAANGLCQVYAGGVAAAVDQLRWLDNADPIIDAQNAVKNGDNRLKAVAGYTILVPGVPFKKEDEYREKFGIVVIPGTSDSIESEEDERLNGVAIEYAKRYNMEVMKRGNREIFPHHPQTISSRWR